MQETLEDIKGLEIYSPDGIFVGLADEVIISIPDMRMSGLFVSSGNPALIDENVSVSIPIGWIQSIGDVIILNRFPHERVTSDLIGR